MKYGIVILILLAAFCAGETARAQGTAVTVRGQLDRAFLVPGVSGSLLVEVTVSGSISGVPQPEIRDVPQGLTVTATQGYSHQSVSIVNGAATTSSTFNFSISASQPGDYTLAGITVSHDGTDYTAPPLVVRVVSPGDANQHREKDPRLYADLVLDRNTAYVGQPVLLTLVMRRIQGINARPVQLQDFDNASFFKGFTYEALQEGQARNETIDGQSYRTDEVLKFVIFPISAGRFDFGPVNLIAQVITRQSFGFFNEGHNQSLPTNVANLEVLPIPEEGRPPEYNGAVGRYTLRAQVDRQEVKVGDLVTLHVVVEGLGNISTLPEPVLPDLSAFASFDPRSKRTKQMRPEGLGGIAEFEYVLSPEDIASNEIGPVKLAWFDPELKQFQVQQTAAIHLNVLPGLGPRGGESAVAIGAPVGMVVLSEEFRHIATNPVLLRDDGVLPLRAAMPALSLLSLAALPVTVFLRRRRSRRISDPAYARRMDAEKFARKRLEGARKMQASSDIKAFYAEIARVLSQYISDLLNRSVAGMTLPELRQALAERDCPDDLIARVTRVLERSDAVRFGASVQVEDMQGSLKEVEDLLNALRQAGIGKGRSAR